MQYNFCVLFRPKDQARTKAANSIVLTFENGISNTFGREFKEICYAYSFILILHLLDVV